MTLWRSLYAGGYGREWGHHIRSSPQPDPGLLQKLDQFVPLWDVFSHPLDHLQPVEFYDVIQWLKTSPDPQPDSIDRWQGYLVESIVRKRKDGFHWDHSDDALEKRWQDHVEREASFHGPPRASDEEVIQCWESV